MKHPLRTLARSGEISWFSFYFADFIARQSNTEAGDLTVLTAALLCESSQQGNVCIDLRHRVGQNPFAAIDQPDPVNELASWTKHLMSNACVGEPGSRSPMILDGSRLYLNRYWHYETAIAEKLAELAKIGPGASEPLAADDDLDADQQQAIQIVAERGLAVISGGPGSGKTSTVIRILQTLLQLEPDCRVALAAPTGKAAARVMQSIREGARKTQLDCRRALVGEASTLHRLLGYRRHGFDYDRSHPLPYDCVIVDVASMIDLKLMFHLLDALAPGARLVLLGDRDQLASVAAGNVLGDMTGHGYRIPSMDVPITASIALLRHNYRFDESSAIGELATLSNLGQIEDLEALLQTRARGLHWFRVEEDLLSEEALEWIYQAYQPIFESESVIAALDAYESSRILCATNRGTCGVDAINATVSSGLLARNGRSRAELYSGLPIMITRNHHELGLYNGDTGILWQQPEGLRACFRDHQGELRDYAINRLPEFSPAWATTVHKSQGSEFDSVLLFLPADPDSEALSRELLYTAITRARRQFRLHSPPEPLRAAANRLTRRDSGLAERLGWIEPGSA